MCGERKTGGGQDNRGRQDNHPIYVLEKSHQANLDRIEDYKKRAVTAENRLRQLEQSVSLRETLIEKIHQIRSMSEGTVEQTFQRRDCTVQPYCRQGQHIPLDNPPAHATGVKDILMLHDQHWVTEQGFWNGIKKGLTKVFEKRKSGVCLGKAAARTWKDIWLLNY